MSLNLVSPGVKVREVDLTIGNISGANDQVGAIAGPFEKGPIDVPILIENEQDLIQTFGKPLDQDAQYEYWMTASSYLSYGGTLRVLRSNSANLNTANVGGGGTSNNDDLCIKSYEDYTANYSNVTTFNYAAKNPGSWGNGLKVATIDHYADQVISGVNVENVEVGMGITQSIAGQTFVSNLGLGSTDKYGDKAVLRGIVTGVGTAAHSTGITTDAFTVKVVDILDEDNGITTAASYDTFKFVESSVTTSSLPTGIGTTTGTLIGALDNEITGITTFLNVSGSGLPAGISSAIAIGDVVTVVGLATTTISIPAGTTVVGIASTTLGLGTITLSQTVTGSGSTSGFVFTRNVAQPDQNKDPLFVIDKEGAGIATFTDTDVNDWYNSQTLGLTQGSDISWNTIAPKPGTSEYANNRNSESDEMHIVVIDEDGTATGIAGNIVEKHLNLSKAKDGKRQPPEEVYYKNYIANKSELIYVGAAIDGVNSTFTARTGSDIRKFSDIVGGQLGNLASNVKFDVIGNRAYDLKEGKDYSTNDNNTGYQVSKGDVINSYNVLKNPAEYSINFILMGPSGGVSKFEAQAKASALIAIADQRKDCIACISPYRNDIVNESNSDTQTNALVDFYSSLQSSSYAVFDSGYKYTYDRFNNEFRYIPLNGDIGGLMARTSINSFSWFSPAGASRGAINGVVKLAYNPTQAQRDIIYPKRINPVIASPGAGIILFGDRTGLGVASAFDRINVRRLFLTLEDTIERAARDQLFEFNDVITRTNFLNIVDPFLRDVKAKRGITDFVVICDETNNTPAVIDANQFKADIFVKPARSINFIGLTFVATRTGVSFEEVVGNV